MTTSSSSRRSWDSVLRKGGDDVWKLSLGAFLHLAGDRRLKDLELREDPPDADALGDGIVATELLRTTTLVPGFFKVDGCTRIVGTLAKQLGIPEARRHVLPYDWRRDNRVAARRLKGLVEAIARADPGARITLVCHSMGGLVARYYSEVLGGWKAIERAVTIATPHRGAVKALNVLLNGVSAKFGPITFLDLTQTLRSFSSVYQLLPIYPCVSLAGRMMRVAEAPIVGLDRDRIVAGAEFHREIQASVERNLSDPEYRARFPFVFPIVGTDQPTLQSAHILSDGTVELLASYPGLELDGDGTVPRISATPIELSNQHRETFTACMHGSIQNAIASFDQIEGIVATSHAYLSYLFYGDVTAGF